MRAKPKQKNIKFNSICFEITQNEYFVKKTKRRHESICLGFISKNQAPKLWQFLLKIAEEVHYSRTLKLCAPGFCRFLMKKMPGMWHFLTRQWSLWELKLRFCNSLKRKQKKCVDLWHSKKFVDGYSHRAFSLNLWHTCFTQPHNPDVHIYTERTDETVVSIPSDPIQPPPLDYNSILLFKRFPQWVITG